MSKIYFLIFTFLLFCACSHTNNFKKVTVVSIYDGDTFKVNLPCKKEVFCKGISVRVKGIDTPEIKTKNIYQKEIALIAKDFTGRLLFDGKIILKNCTRDKYFRMLCDVFIIKEKKEINLAKELLSSGLAVKYDGKTKTCAKVLLGF